MIIKAKTQDNEIIDCELEYIDDGKHCEINFKSNKIGNYFVNEIDIFSCFQELRKKLQSDNVILLCYGSRIDVYPSHMSRSMGGGLKAYIQTMDKPATRDELHNIFEFYDGIEIGSVEDQIEFNKRWLKSLLGENISKIKNFFITE